MTDAMQDLPESTKERPLVTFALFAYNQEPFIREAVLSAFAQTYEPLEIILSDDASTDGTYEIISELAAQYRGPHTVRCNQNSKNLGLIAHVNTVCDLACGDLIVVAAGDDVSLPERTTELVRVFVSAPGNVHAIHSAVFKIGPAGEELGLLEPPHAKGAQTPEAMKFRLNGVIGASHAWSKALMQRFGPIRESGTYEDLAIAFRAALLGGVKYIDKPLVRYRFGVGMSTANLENLSQEAERNRKIKATRLWLATARQRALDSRIVGRYVLSGRLTYAAFKARIKIMLLEAIS